jgi:hypothetical protein
MRPSDYAGSNPPTAFVAQTSAMGPPTIQLAYGARQLRDDYALAILGNAELAVHLIGQGSSGSAVWDMVDVLLAERERRNTPPPEEDPINGKRLRLT